MGGHTNTHWDTITHINEQNNYVRGYSPISVTRSESICSLFFFCKTCTNTAKALTWLSFEFPFMHINTISSQIDPDIYELGLTCILLFSLLLLCISGEENNIMPVRGGAEAKAITASIIGLVWFMIYTDHIQPEITPLEALGCLKKKKNVLANWLIKNCHMGKYFICIYA